jgi:type IV secretory pathway TrbD component
MTVRPTARALNKPLLIVGIERKLLGMAFVISAVVAAISGTQPHIQIPIGLGVFITTIAAAKRATKKDDRIFQIALSVWRQKAVYDPCKREVKR